MSSEGTGGNGGMRTAKERKGQDVRREEREQAATSSLGFSSGQMHTWPGYRAWQAVCRLELSLPHLPM